MAMKGKNGRDDEEELRERCAIFLVGMVMGIIIGVATGMLIGAKLNLLAS